MLKAYYQLTKPGIIYDNVLTAVAGFFLAAKGHIHLALLLETALGTSLVIAAACVYNNYIDRNIDKKMKRTEKRALVTGQISPRSALLFATVLVVAGFLVLVSFTNKYVIGAGLVGFVDYIALYGYFKRHSTVGTVVGSISGAMPIAAGYLAVSGRIDAGAVIVFLMLVTWQMPHFYAIAMYRSADYAAAEVPVLPVVKGMRMAKVQISAYIVAFILACAALTVFDYAGYVYLAVMLLAGITWLARGLQGFKTGTDDVRWARKMFFFSLMVILVLVAATATGSVLP